MKALNILLSIVILFGRLKELSALEAEWPILAFERGSVAHIPCMVRGETKAYFWRRGSAYNVSEHVAANVHGVPDEFANATQGKLTVNGDGSLAIYGISPEDDDTYFCRVVTQTSEHYGGVTIYSQASFDSFLSIDKCSSHVSCTVRLQLYSKYQFTCTASYVSLMVDLKWIDNNGTVITMRSVSKQNADGSFNISLKVEGVYDGPTSISCEAFSPAIGREFVSVRLESEEISKPVAPRDGYFVAFLVTVVVATVVIVTIITVCKICTPKEKDREKGLVEEGVSLKTSVKDEVDELKDKLQESEHERDLLLKEKRESEHERDLLLKEKKEIENERDLLLKSKKNLHLDLELSERKYRAHRSKVKDKQKVFLRIKPQEGSSTVSASSDKIKEWGDRYNFTKIFTQDTTQETIFTDTEAAELIQDTVDGGKTFIFAFGGPNSGRTYTMRGQEKTSEIHPAMGLIPRAVLQVFQLVDDLKRKEIEVKVTVSRLKSYETLQGNAVHFIELSHLDPEKNAFYNVQGLKVEMKVYVVTKPEEVLDLLWGEPSRASQEVGTEMCDLLQIYIETMKDSQSISKGILSFAILSATEATRQLSGHNSGNRSIRPLLESFLKDDTCNMTIISNIALDMTRDAMETLNAVTKVSNVKYYSQLSPEPGLTRLTLPVIPLTLSSLLQKLTFCAERWDVDVVKRSIVIL